MSKETLVRTALAVIVVVLAASAITHYLHLRREIQELTTMLERFGTAKREPVASADVAYETDRLRAGLKAARILLAEEVDRRWLDELTEEERSQALAYGKEKLERARELALSTLEARPTSWQAMMILGGSRYLLASRQRVPGRWSNRAQWEAPLLRAAEIAPLQPEPTRILAAAYLSEWSLIASPDRQAILPTLARAFENLNTLDQLLRSWFRQAESLDQAFSVIPNDLRAWQQVEHYFRTQRDWLRLRDVRERIEEVLPVHLTTRLDAATDALSVGDQIAARRLVIGAILKAPVRLEYQPHLERALELLPPGPLPEGQAARLRLWIDWALERCLTATCPFSRATGTRLGTLAREQSPSRQAVAALIGGDLRTAQAIEDRSMAVPKESWHPYLLLKSKFLAERGEVQRAITVADYVQHSEGYDVLKAAVLRELRPENGSNSARLLDSGWRGNETTRKRLLLGPEPLSLLRLSFADVGEDGAVFETRINGILVGPYFVESGSTVSIPIESPRAMVILEIERLGGPPLHATLEPPTYAPST